MISSSKGSLQCFASKSLDLNRKNTFEQQEKYMLQRKNVVKKSDCHGPRNYNFKTFYSAFT